MHKKKESENNAHVQLRHVKEALDTIGDQLRNGSFPRNASQGEKGTCTAGGIAFAAEVPPPGDNVSSAFTIVTPHADEACAFLDRIYELFRPLLDECIEHDFFGRIAEAAVAYSCYVDPRDASVVNLMKVILTEAGDILADMIAGDFPFASRRCENG